MNKEYFLKLANYNIWANDICTDWLNQISEEQWNQPLIGSMASIAATAIHIAGAEKIWYERLENNPSPFLSSHFDGDKMELVNIWKKASKNLLIYIENLPESDLLSKFNYSNIKGEPFHSLKFEALAHVFNHSTYHRGQIVNYLRQVGFTKVGSTDLIQFYRLNS
ncbi:MAG: DinB family protein [Bacteroidota bacterium]